MTRNKSSAFKLAVAPTSGDQTQSTQPQNTLEIHAAYVVANDAGAISVRLFGVDHKATIGVLLPMLVVGDYVAVAYCKTGALVTVLGIVAPNPANPLHDRAIKLESTQVITLQTGDAKLVLTGDGLARLIAHRIEQDARDLVRIDAAEIRMN
jgi:hypothetical protein